MHGADAFRGRNPSMLGADVLSAAPFATDSQGTGMMLVRGGGEHGVAPESREIYDSLASW